LGEAGDEVVRRTVISRLNPHFDPEGFLRI
jgi:hypothetical protein